MRMRKMIEEALLGKIEQCKSEQGSESRETSPPSSIASGPSRRLSVRFAEPEKEKEKPRSPVRNTVKEEKPKAIVSPTPEVAKPQSLAPSPAPTPAPALAPAPVPVPVTVPAQAPTPAPVVSEQEKNLSKELVLQTREIQKLELEVEKRDVLIKEKEKLEQDMKLKEELSVLERKKDHERELKQLQKERAEVEKTEKERERAVQKELQLLEKEKKEIAKAEKERERAVHKELQRLEKEKKEIERAEKEREQELQRQREQLEKEKQEVARAQEEHDKLQASFVEQGKILSDLKSRFDEQSKTLEATETERADLQKKTDDFERKCSDLSRTLSHVSDKERFVVEQVASLQIIKEALQGRLGPLEKRVEDQKQDIEGLTKERDGLYLEVKSYLLRITELETDIKGLIEEKREFIAQVGGLEKTKSDLQDEVRERDGKIADRDCHIVTLTENLEARAKEAQEHVASLKDKHIKNIVELQAAKQAQLDEVKKEHTALISVLEDQIAGLDEHVDGAHVDIDNLKSNITSLEGILAEEKAKSDALTSERDAAVRDLETHKSLAISQEASVLNLRGDIATRDEELATLKETNNTLQAEHEELQQLADSLDDRQSQDQISYKDLQAKNAELEEQVGSTKTELEDRIRTLEGERDTAATALIVAQAELGNAKAAADKVPALEEAAARVPGLTAEKAELEERLAGLESHASQVPALRSHCDRLAEQLSAANKLIEGLTAAQQAGLSSAGSVCLSAPVSPMMAPPMMVPPSPKLPQDIPVPESPRLAPQRKVRSRAPSMVRSISSRSSVSSRRDRGPKDDIALVMVRDSKDRGSVTVVRKCDLKSPRSRSQPPVKE